jgi:hypothetical protein
MPAAQWPGTVQKNVYLPRLSLRVSALVACRNVGVAPTTAPRLEASVR